jgi:hypothetical protein
MTEKMPLLGMTEKKDIAPVREQYLIGRNCLFRLLCLLAVYACAVTLLASLVLVALFIASLVTRLLAVLVTFLVTLLLTSFVTCLIASGITRCLASLSSLIATSAISTVRALCCSTVGSLLIIVASARCSSEHCSHYCQ